MACVEAAAARLGLPVFFAAAAGGGGGRLLVVSISTFFDRVVLLDDMMNWLGDDQDCAKWNCSD
jgi:hypothetical protein